MAKKNGGDSRNYDVGYRRPPKATQFKCGTSGNPRGRPKQIKSIAELADEIMRERVVVTEDGSPRTYSRLEISLRQQARKAARGDERALKFFTSILPVLVSVAAQAATGLQKATDPNEAAELYRRLIRGEK